MEKEWNFAADKVKVYGFKKWTRDCGWQWGVADTLKPFKMGIRQSKKELSTKFKL